MVKKYFLVIVLLTAIDCFASADSYITHCNFAFGFSYSQGGETASLNTFDFQLLDGYNDGYHFNHFVSTSGLGNVGFNLSLSLPFYYQQYFSVGASGQVFISGLVEGSSMYYFGGLYAEGIYNKYSLRLGINLAGGSISEKLNPIVAAWPGDPGFYTGSKFLKLGNTLWQNQTNIWVFHGTQF